MEDNREITQEHEEQQESQELKTFTQEEVEDIIKRRLARERKKNDRETGTDGQDREKDLEARELKLKAKEKLFDAGMPLNLADVLRYDDEKTLDEAIQSIQELNREAPKGWGQRVSSGNTASTQDPIRKAMGLDRKG